MLVVRILVLSQVCDGFDVDLLFLYLLFSALVKHHFILNMLSSLNNHCISFSCLIAVMVGHALLLTFSSFLLEC